MRIDVKQSPELLATLAAMRTVDATVAKQVRVHLKAVAGPEWEKALRRRANTALERRVIADTAVTSVSNQNVRVQSAGKGRPLSHGLNPKVDYPGVEFGSKRQKRTYSRRSRRGGTHRVRRTVGTQFKEFRGTGYVFFPAAEEMIPRISSLYVQTVVKSFGNALEGKQE